MIEAVIFMCMALIISMLTAAWQPDAPNQSAEVSMKRESAPEAQIEAKKALINPGDWP